MPKAKVADKEEVKEEGDILLQYSGLEHVREVQRSDLETYPESETTLTWDASNNFISPVGLTEDEVQVLARSGGSWAVVTEESSTAPEEDEHIELPTVAAPPIETQEGVDPESVE